MHSLKQAIRSPAAVLLLALMATPAAATPITLSATPVSLDPSDDGKRLVGELEFLAGFDLTSSEPKWGSLSGLVVAADGASLVAVADTGQWFRAVLQQAEDGRLTGVGTAEMQPLLDTRGKRLPNKHRADAEALAETSGGSLVVAFEGRHRMWRYDAAKDPLEAAATRIATPADLEELPGNGGIEAFAILDSGRLVMLSEEGYTPSGDLRGWLEAETGWADITLARTGSFRPSDLARLPNGDLLLLERHFSLIGGFAARLSVISAESLRPGAVLAGREIAIIRAPLTVDNFEGVAARKGPDGSTLIYLVSDDNTNPFQRTLLLQFRWPATR